MSKLEKHCGKKKDFHRMINIIRGTLTLNKIILFTGKKRVLFPSD